MGTTIDQIRHRRDREKRLSASLNEMIELAAAFEDERNAIHVALEGAVRALEAAKRKHAHHVRDCAVWNSQIHTVVEGVLQVIECKCTCGADSHNTALDLEIAAAKKELDGQ